jgi:hypothetical protein
MNKLSRLVVLVPLLAFTLWGATPKPAHALLSCYVLDGKGCRTPGSQVACTWAPGVVGVCECVDFFGVEELYFWTCV